ncbi:BRANCHLESS TRICHOMES [Hibiscus trionum]|uniref:BRANCHLESS TRICHOMES n=1 Tax=Hibiscus trionum TaxID=183268 RepID=A0A9W7IEF8_HIBTR|nr:BRANCHLESS TRICHOMES [Hibiscus trionum]
MKREDMEEVTMMMSRSSGNRSNGAFPQHQEPITTSTCPRWKLYDNPFYYSRPSSKHLHQFWDLTLFKPVMDSDLDFARAHIIELKAEMEYERKARNKAESMNKKLAKQVGEERREREALERVCEKLAREISLYKSAIVGLKKEVEEERKMLRMAEVLREERVQMKLADAKILFEEKLSEFNDSKRMNPVPRISQKITANVSGKFSRLVFSEKSLSSVSSSMEIQNPHIKRGIKGFVEFPTMARAIGSKLECRKAQLKILLKQKSPIRSNSLITS